jgi:hypothetical protein
VTKVAFVLIACALAASCASQAPMPQPAAAPMVARATPPPAPAAPQPASPAASGASSVVPNKDLISQGYRLMQVKGQPVYCRSEAVTGSNLKNKVCKSEAQILFDQQRAQDVTRQYQGMDCYSTAGTNYSTGCLH